MSRKKTRSRHVPRFPGKSGRRPQRCTAWTQNTCHRANGPGCSPDWRWCPAGTGTHKVAHEPRKLPFQHCQFRPPARRDFAGPGQRTQGRRTRSAAVSKSHCMAAGTLCVQVATDGWHRSTRFGLRACESQRTTCCWINCRASKALG